MQRGGAIFGSRFQVWPRSQQRFYGFAVPAKYRLSTAQCRGVRPPSARASSFAPAAASAAMASAFPITAAACSGVWPPAPRASKSAPACRHRVTSETSAARKKDFVFQAAQSICACAGATSATPTVATTRRAIGFMALSPRLLHTSLLPVGADEIVIFSSLESYLTPAKVAPIARTAIKTLISSTLMFSSHPSRPFSHAP